MFTALISPGQAESIIHAHFVATGDESVGLDACWGRVLRAAVVADRDFPPYHRATMDGYLSREPLQAGQVLAVRGSLLAGNALVALPPQCLVEVATGACLSDRNLHLAPYEWTSKRADGTVEIRQGTTSGQFIHPRAADALQGEVILPAGQVMGAAEIAIAASAGATTLRVASKARIALLTTGNEVVPYQSTPEPWQIRGSHGPVLHAILRAGGYPSIITQHVGDDFDETLAALSGMREQADVIIVTGGICAGAKDVVRDAACALWGNAQFHGIAQKPGKPMAFWSGPPAVFALPGNPLSVLTTFSRYVIPALCLMEGREPRGQFLTISRDLAGHEHLTLFLPVDDCHYECAMFSNSGNLFAARGATGIVEIPPQNATLTRTPSCAFYPYQFPSP